MSSDGGLFDQIRGRLEDDSARDEASSKQPSFSMADLVTLPEDQASLARFILRATTYPTVDEVAVALDWPVENVSRVSEQLIERGAIKLNDGRLQPASAWRIQRPKADGIWSRLGDL